jgi:hypothetical protein
MVTTHNLGFPRIGAKRELKFALEAYWKGQSSRDELKALGKELRQRHWQNQSGLDLVPVGDFAFYDQVLDMSFTLGNLPERVHGFHGDPLDNYFRVARGRSAAGAEDHAGCCGGVAAGEMTKWFDTNYHYIVPEFTADTEFKLDASRLLQQLASHLLMVGQGQGRLRQVGFAGTHAARLCQVAGATGRGGRGVGADRRANTGYRTGCQLAACAEPGLPPP